jgi:hypothetical protein
MLLQAERSFNFYTPMRFPKWLVGLLAISPALVLSAEAQQKPAEEVIIKMDPYVVSGERVLPPPESWRYVSVPAGELTIGKKVIVAPGYEVLSSLSDKNTKIFVEEVQLRQFTGTLLWPMIVKALPRQPMVVIIDRNKQAWTSTDLPVGLAWQGEPIAAAEAQSSGFDSVNYNTGMQYSSMVEQSFAPGDPRATELNTMGTRMIQDGNPTSFTEPKAFETKRGIQPLPAGFTRVRANSGIVAAQINADAPKANTDSPDEERLAADLSRRAAEYALSTFSQEPPLWFRSGLGWLIATTQVTPTRITFADTNGMLDRTVMPSLATLLDKTTALTFEEDLLSAAFTHWGLYGDNQKHAPKFMQLVQEQSQGPVSPERFQEIFGLSIKKMEMELVTYSRTFAAYKSVELHGDLPPMPAMTIREATQSEVARLQAEAFITQGKPDLALNVLRIAYWRGEREPVMLACLAGLEESQGSLERARKITQGLISLSIPPAKILTVEAKLLFRDATANKQSEEKLSTKETRLIMDPLGRAIKAGQNSEDICEFFAQVVLRSAGQPHESVIAFLNQAAKHYPKNETIHKANLIAQPKPTAS